MQNSVLAPLVALLVLLGVAWAGLFGLTRVSSEAAEQPRSPAATAPSWDAPQAGGSPAPRPTPSPGLGDSPARGDSPGLGDSRAPASDEGGFSDAIPGEHQVEPRRNSGGFLDRLAGRDGTATTTDRNPGTDADADGRTDMPSFLDRLAGRQAPGETTNAPTATDTNPRDPAGLSNRGAAVLIIVLALLAMGGAAKRRR
ncbi:MAG: hypothetical protein Q4G43_11960 [Mobilicoccus sp.]|nr:hypothetical protein [Mobilicoccus sp.]